MPVKKVPKAYAVVSTSQVASTTVELAIGVGGYDFLLEALAGICTDDANGGFRFNFTPSDTGRKWSNINVNAGALFSDPKDAARPYRIDGGPHSDPRLDAPLRIQKGSTITVEIQEIAAGVNTITVVLLGHELIPG